MQGYARGTGECQRHEDPRMQRGGSVGGVRSENDWCMPTGVSVAHVGVEFGSDRRWQHNCCLGAAGLSQEASGLEKDLRMPNGVSVAHVGVEFGSDGPWLAQHC